MKKFRIYSSAVLAAMFLLSAVLSSCGGVELTQDVSTASIITCRKYIQTEVWVKDCWGNIVSMEYHKLVVVPYAQVDSTKKAERMLAVPTFELAKNSR